MDIDHISHEIEIDAPILRVWDALTEPTQLGKWFGSAGKFRRGADDTLQLSWEAHGSYHATIEAEEKPHWFAWRWALAPDVEPSPGNSTLVEFRLLDLDGRTRLSVTESGFVSLDLTEGEKGAAVNDNLAGWVGGFVGLKQYLEGYRESALPGEFPGEPS